MVFLVTMQFTKLHQQPRYVLCMLKVITSCTRQLVKIIMTSIVANWASDVVAGVASAARRAHGLAGCGERVVRLLVGRRHRAADLDDGLRDDDGGVLLVLLVVEDGMLGSGRGRDRGGDVVDEGSEEVFDAVLFGEGQTAFDGDPSTWQSA